VCIPSAEHSTELRLAKQAAERGTRPCPRLDRNRCGISFQPWSSPLPAGFTQRYAPTIDGLNADRLVEPSCEFWIGYVR